MSTEERVKTKPKKILKKRVKKPVRPKPVEQKPKKERHTHTYLKWSALFAGIVIAVFLIFYAIYHFTKFTALAEYRGGRVTRGEFIKVLKTDTGKYDPLVWKNEQQSLKIKSNILDELIRENILLNMANAQNITVSDQELKIELDSYKSGYTEKTFRNMLKSRDINYDDWIERKRKKYLIQKLIKIDVIDKIKIDQSEIKKYYNSHVSEFTHPQQVRARQILVNTWEDAEKIQEELKNGGNFAAIAKKKSISPDRWKGGDLGYFPRGSHPEIFDRVCFNTPVGEISQIIRSDYGYHLFKVIDKRGPYKEGLKEAQPYIITQLQQQQSKESFEKWFKPIYDAASIEINHDLLKQIEVISNGEGSKH